MFLILPVVAGLFVLKIKNNNKQFNILADLGIGLCAGFCLASGIVGMVDFFFEVGLLATIFSGVELLICIIMLILDFDSKIVKHKPKSKNKASYNEIYEKLTKLKTLYESNILTKEEYEEKRKKYTEML